jgi:hypothetical protein
MCFLTIRTLVENDPFSIGVYNYVLVAGDKYD